MSFFMNHSFCLLILLWATMLLICLMIVSFLSQFSPSPSLLAVSPTCLLPIVQSAFPHQPQFKQPYVHVVSPQNQLTCLIITVTSLLPHWTRFFLAFSILFPLAWVTTSFPGHIVNLFSPLFLKPNQHHSLRPWSLKCGVMLWILNCRHWKAMTLGPFALFPLANKWLVVNGCTKSSFELMALWIGTKHALWLRDLHNKKVLIILIPSRLLPS